MLPPALLARGARRHGVFSASDALACGLDHDELARLLRSGAVVRLGRGVYAPAECVAADPQRCAHAAALLAYESRGAVLAGRSAACAWGLPLIGPAPQRVELVVEEGREGLAPGWILRVAALPRAHRAEASGLPATSLARTVLDIGRAHGFLDAVVAADAALARGLDRGELAAAGEVMAGWPGMRPAMRAAAFADGRSGSAAESLSRVRFAEHGLPAPQLQVRLTDAEGLVGFADFCWPGVVGECDGRLKYADPEALWAEKRREDRIRALGLRVVRWGWDDAWARPAWLCGRIGAALREAA